MNNNLKWQIILVVAAIFIQTVWPTAFKFAYLRFDAFLLLTIFFVLTTDWKYALLWAFGLGVLQDALSTGCVLQTAILPAVALIAFETSTFLASDPEKNFLLLTAILTPAVVVLQLAAQTMFALARPDLQAWFYYLVIVWAGNMLFALVAIFIFSQVEGNLYRFSKYNPMIRQI